MRREYCKPNIVTAATSSGYSLVGTSGGTVVPPEPEDEQTLDCDPINLGADKKYDIL